MMYPPIAFLSPSEKLTVYRAAQYIEEKKEFSKDLTEKIEKLFPTTQASANLASNHYKSITACAREIKYDGTRKFLQRTADWNWHNEHTRQLIYHYLNQFPETLIHLAYVEKGRDGSASNDYIHEYLSNIIFYTICQMRTTAQGMHKRLTTVWTNPSSTNNDKNINLIFSIWNSIINGLKPVEYHRSLSSPESTSTMHGFISMTSIQKAFYKFWNSHLIQIIANSYIEVKCTSSKYNFRGNKQYTILFPKPELGIQIRVTPLPPPGRAKVGTTKLDQICVRHLQRISIKNQRITMVFKTTKQSGPGQEFFEYLTEDEALKLFSNLRWSVTSPEELYSRQ